MVVPPIGRRSFSDGTRSNRASRHRPAWPPFSAVNPGFTARRVHGCVAAVPEAAAVRSSPRRPPAPPPRDVPSGHSQLLTENGDNLLLNLFSIGFFEESAFAADGLRPGWPACRRAAKRKCGFDGKRRKRTGLAKFIENGQAFRYSAGP